jgi:hypothetical protein
MTALAPSTFDNRLLDALTIDDEESFRHVGVYGDLKESLRRDRYTFRVITGRQAERWDRALCLNLTFWGSGGDSDKGGDVLVGPRIAADVVAHVAWHHLAAKALGREASKPGSGPTADALFLGESIASAFDVYLVGRLLGHAPHSSFLETQVPAMADAAAEAGLSDDGFEELLAGIAKDPEEAFESLRALLFDVSRALVACEGVAAALAIFDRFDDHRFAPLLHRFELSNWVLYARAYAAGHLAPDPKVAAIDAALRKDDGGLAWLTERWLSR